VTRKDPDVKTYSLDGVLEVSRKIPNECEEAMSSHRPYHPRLGIEPSLAEITKNRDKLYDAAVFDACVEVFREKRFVFST